MTAAPPLRTPIPPGYACRVPSLEDAPAMLRVIESAFDTWPAHRLEGTPLDHLRWKMGSHPRAAQAHAIVEHQTDASHTPEMVGVTIRILSDVFLRGRPLVSKTGADNAVPPQWQGNHIADMWSNWSAARCEGPVWDINISFLPQHPASRHRSETRGSVYVANRVVALYRSFAPRQFAAVHGRTAGPIHLATATARHLAWRARRAPDPPPPPTLRIHRIDRFDARANTLAAAALPQFDFSYGRSADHLNWRHADPHGGPSILLAAQDGDDLRGYAVVRTGTDVAHLADILIDPSHPQTITPLLSAALDAARQSGLQGIQIWLPQHHPYRAALERQGFLESGLDARCHYRGPGAAPELGRALHEVLANPRALIHITSADTDWI